MKAGRKEWTGRARLGTGEAKERVAGGKCLNERKSTSDGGRQGKREREGGSWVEGERERERPSVDGGWRWRRRFVEKATRRGRERNGGKSETQRGRERRSTAVGWDLLVRERAAAREKEKGGKIN